MRLSALPRHGVDLAEVLTRQLYWRLGHRLLGDRRRGRRRDRSHAGAVSKAQLADHLHRLGTGEGGLLMVHSSVEGLAVLDGGQRMSHGQTALWLLETLRQVTGASGTLCMPTHPLYREDPGFMFDKSELVLPYSVLRTPSSVGLLTEFFRRTPGTRRSPHPLSSLAANGPLASTLLDGNLDAEEPLPHGRDSSYHRFCAMGGRVISLGLPLLKFLTVLHVAEEVRDRSWPVPGFFYRRRFRVDSTSGTPQETIVRERRPEFVRALALQRVHRDLLKKGILVEGRVGGTRLDVVDARALLDFMERQQRHSTYPYLFPRLAGIGRPPRVKPPRQTTPSA